MDLARIDLNLLTTFEALLLEGSVTGAARRLGLGQPATSAALARLRALLGDPLFERAGGRMQPTPRAQALAPGVLAALEGLRASLGAAIPFAAGAAARSFTLAVTDYAVAVVLPPLTRAVAAAAPGVDLRLVGPEKDAVPLLLDRGEADLALGVFPDAPDRFIRTRLLEEGFEGIARRGHPALTSGRMELEAWLAQPQALVTLRRDAAGAVDAALAALGRRRRIALTLPHMLAVPAFLAGTELVAALPSRVIDRFDPAAIARFPLPVTVPPWWLEMLWNPAARTDNATAWLRERLREAVQTLRAETAMA